MIPFSYSTRAHWIRYDSVFEFIDRLGPNGNHRNSGEEREKSWREWRKNDDDHHLGDDCIWFTDWNMNFFYSQRERRRSGREKYELHGSSIEWAFFSPHFHLQSLSSSLVIQMLMMMTMMRILSKKREEIYTITRYVLTTFILLLYLILSHSPFQEWWKQNFKDD